jgi:membrane-bound metal-dependent hydrolase YbcI (DUF457 family)
MDPITHGLSGAVVAGAFAGEPHSRAARWAIILGSVFPDVDVVENLFDPDGLGTIRLHRSVTHSLVCLPVFAFLLAALTSWFCRRRGITAPRLSVLTLLYGCGIALHILFDVITSFGTMIWSPIDWTRVAWDWTFILDLTLTGTLLYFLLLAWVAGGGEKKGTRAVWLVVLIAALAGLYGAGACALGQGFPWTVFGAVVLLAILPALRVWSGGGLAFQPRAWCRFGILAVACYLAANAVEHHRALERVQRNAAAEHLDVVESAALPLPMNLTWWLGLVQTPDGVHEWTFSLAGGGPAAAASYFTPATAGDECPVGLWQLSQVRAYLRFARFPVMECRRVADGYVAQFYDLRFLRPALRWVRAQSDPKPGPFTYRVTLDAAGKLRKQEWVVN